MLATTDYNPNEISPSIHSHDKLAFHSGDIIYIHGNIRDDGLYIGELENGKKGLVFPEYLKEILEENLQNEIDENQVN